MGNIFENIGSNVTGGVERVFNYSHMTGIESDFSYCETDIGDAVKELEKLMNHVRDNYTGQANTMLYDILVKLRDHLLVLQSSHDGTSKFVGYAKKESFDWDGRSGQ